MINLSYDDKTLIQYRQERTILLKTPPIADWLKVNEESAKAIIDENDDELDLLDEPNSIYTDIKYSLWISNFLMSTYTKYSGLLNIEIDRIKNLIECIRSATPKYSTRQKSAAQSPHIDNLNYDNLDKYHIYRVELDFWFLSFYLQYKNNPKFKNAKPRMLYVKNKKLLHELFNINSKYDALILDFLSNQNMSTAVENHIYEALSTNIVRLKNKAHEICATLKPYDLLPDPIMPKNKSVNKFESVKKLFKLKNTNLPQYLHAYSTHKGETLFDLKYMASHGTPKSKNSGHWKKLQQLHSLTSVYKLLNQNIEEYTKLIVMPFQHEEQSTDIESQFFEFNYYFIDIIDYALTIASKQLKAPLNSARRSLINNGKIFNSEIDSRKKEKIFKNFTIISTELVIVLKEATNKIHAKLMETPLPKIDFDNKKIKETIKYNLSETRKAMTIMMSTGLNNNITFAMLNLYPNLYYMFDSIKKHLAEVLLGTNQLAIKSGVSFTSKIYDFFKIYSRSNQCNGHYNNSIAQTALSTLYFSIEPINDKMLAQIRKYLKFHCHYSNLKTETMKAKNDKRVNMVLKKLDAHMNIKADCNPIDTRYSDVINIMQYAFNLSLQKHMCKEDIEENLMYPQAGLNYTTENIYYKIPDESSLAHYFSAFEIQLSFAELYSKIYYMIIIAIQKLFARKLSYSATQEVIESLLNVTVLFQHKLSDEFLLTIKQYNCYIRQFISSTQFEIDRKTNAVLPILIQGMLKPIAAIFQYGPMKDDFKIINFWEVLKFDTAK